MFITFRYLSGGHHWYLQTDMGSDVGYSQNPDRGGGVRTRGDRKVRVPLGRLPVLVPDPQ